MLRFAIWLVPICCALLVLYVFILRFSVVREDRVLDSIGFLLIWVLILSDAWTMLERHLSFVAVSRASIAIYCPWNRKRLLVHRSECVGIFPRQRLIALKDKRYVPLAPAMLPWIEYQYGPDNEAIVRKAMRPMFYLSVFHAVLLIAVGLGSFATTIPGLVDAVGTVVFLLLVLLVAIALALRLIFGVPQDVFISLSEAQAAENAAKRNE